jgi:hypothetical protein
MENIKGRIASVKEWPSGKGSFVKLENDERDFYKFGRNGVAAGLEIEAQVQPGTGSFSEKICITKILSAAKIPGPEPKKPFPVEDMDAGALKAKWAGFGKTGQAAAGNLPTKDEEDQLTAEWRALAISTMRECSKDASNVFANQPEASTDAMACAMFCKRMKPLFFYVEEKRARVV